LAGAHSAADPRKGGAFIAEALSRQELRTAPVTVVVFGDVEPGHKALPGWMFTGRIRDERLMNLYYNAADLFVHPSLADNLPNTLIEAMAAGTPAVTFDIGGCAEVVRHEKTGYVAKYRDVGDLANGIQWILGMPADEKQQIQRRCRELAENEYAVELMAGRYMARFEKSMSRLIR